MELDVSSLKACLMPAWVRAEAEVDVGVLAPDVSGVRAAGAIVVVVAVAVAVSFNATVRRQIVRLVCCQTILLCLLASQDDRERERARARESRITFDALIRGMMCVAAQQRANNPHKDG